MGPKKRPAASTTLSSPTNPTSPQMKFRPVMETGRWAAKGTKPLPDPITLPEILTKVLIHGCKKVIFLKPVYRIVGYAVLLFFVSLVSDYMPLPRTYFSSSGNVLNQYFVKWSWAWTIVLLSSFVGLTSSVYCCGKGPLMSRHGCRLLIATIIWFTWTSLFQVLEETTGQCLFPANPQTQTPAAVLYSKGRRHCLKNGGKWTSFDISGHSFILIWCVLFITEECKAILGWDTIADFIRNEEHKRKMVAEAQRRPSVSSADFDLQEETPISHLSPEDFEKLKKLYGKFGIWAKLNVVALTLLTLLWDLMLVATACYFHIMIEKVLAGLIAICMWAFVYRGFYSWDISVSPGLPGVGMFKYMPAGVYSTCSTAASETSKGGISSSSKGQGSSGLTTDDVPHFMGMPLYQPKKKGAQGTGIIGMGSEALS